MIFYGLSEGKRGGERNIEISKKQFSKSNQIRIYIFKVFFS